MTRLGTGDGARRPAPVILPRDVRERPRYASASAPWPGEDVGRQKAAERTHVRAPDPPPAASNPSARDLKPHAGVGISREAPPLIDRIIEHFAGLLDGGGDLGMELAGVIAEAGDDKRARARALCRARKQGQHSANTKFVTIERRERIREFAARHPGMSMRAIAARVGVSEGTVRRASKSTAWDAAALSESDNCPKLEKSEITLLTV